MIPSYQNLMDHMKRMATKNSPQLRIWFHLSHIHLNLLALQTQPKKKKNGSIMSLIARHGTSKKQTIHFSWPNTCAPSTIIKASFLSMMLGCWAPVRTYTKCTLELLIVCTLNWLLGTKTQVLIKKVHIRLRSHYADAYLVVYRRARSDR